MFYIRGMQHQLDNLIWNALNAGSRSLAQGNDAVKFFDPAVATFAGMRDPGPEALSELWKLWNTDKPAIFINREQFEVGKQWKPVFEGLIYQLVALTRNTEPLTSEGISLKKLGEENIPAMLRLTEATKPGPFFERTIDFGNYYGVFEGGELAAMGGYRLQPKGFTEISAVCTDPAHLGKGYASAIVRFLAASIHEEGSIPFLHASYDNHRALGVYKRLGFEERCLMHVQVLERLP